ncbi:MAG: hypothetical protein IPH53_18125 [Flavobacteriales bacterium]|nr:hypothetical protein [Flavobacteriales bacterium]
MSEPKVGCTTCVNVAFSSKRLSLFLAIGQEQGQEQGQARRSSCLLRLPLPPEQAAKVG